MFDIFVSIFDRGSWSINAHIQFEHFIWDRNNFSELSKTLSYELLAKRSISAKVICKCGFFFAFKGMGRKKRWWCGWGWEGECWSKWGHNLLLSNRPKLYMILRRMQWHCATHFTYTSYIAFFFFPFYPQKLTA